MTSYFKTIEFANFRKNFIVYVFFFTFFSEIIFENKKDAFLNIFWSLFFNRLILGICGCIHVDMLHSAFMMSKNWFMRPALSNSSIRYQFRTI